MSANVLGKDLDSGVTSAVVSASEAGVRRDSNPRVRKHRRGSAHVWPTCDPAPETWTLGYCIYDPWVFSPMASGNVAYASPHERVVQGRVLTNSAIRDLLRSFVAKRQV